MFPVSHAETQPSTFNTREACLWKMEALLSVLFTYHADMKKQRRVSSTTSRASSFHDVWTLFMKPSCKWPFFSQSAAWRKKINSCSRLAASFIFYFFAEAHAAPAQLFTRTHRSRKHTNTQTPSKFSCDLKTPTQRNSFGLRPYPAPTRLWVGWLVLTG